VTLLEQLIEWSCRFFAQVRFVRQVGGDKVAVLGFIGRVTDQSQGVSFDARATELAQVGIFRRLTGDMLSCFEGLGVRVESDPKTASEEAAIVLRLLERGVLAFTLKRAAVAIESPGMLCGDGETRPVFMIRNQGQPLLELLQNFETWIAQYGKDLTS
jgi:hypothetical protein